jgi:hypothetical protein
MSQLEIHGRPWAVFDPSNQQHRAWYHNFVKTSSWGSCPVRFVVPDDHGDLITMMQRCLVRYYTTVEFALKKPKKARLSNNAQSAIINT